MIELLVDLYRDQIGADPAKNVIMIFCALFVLVGIGSIIHGIHLKMKLKSAAVSWPFVDGTIIGSEVASFTKHESGDRPRKMRSADISFTYDIDGKNYVSDKIHWGGRISSNFGSFAESQVAKYPVGKKVRVYYNPVNYSDCVVEVKFGFAEALPLIFGVIATLMGTVFALTFLLPNALKPLPTVYFFALVAFTVLVVFVLPRFRTDALKPGWKNVKGVLKHTEIKVNCPPGETVGPDEQVHYVQGTFEYQFAGRPYQMADRITIPLTKEYVEKRQQQIAIGSKKSILVNPDAPGEAIVNDRGLVLWIGFLIFLAMPAFLVPVVATKTSLKEAGGFHLNYSQKSPKQEALKQRQLQFKGGLALWARMYTENLTDTSYAISPGFQDNEQCADDIFIYEQNEFSSVVDNIMGSIEFRYRYSGEAVRPPLPPEVMEEIRGRITTNIEKNYRIWRETTGTEKE